MAKAATSPPKTYAAVDFFLDDLPRTLFPLSTNRILVEKGHDKLIAFANDIIAKDRRFLPQRRVYANKDALHLRRTVKLDPVAEYFLYDLMFRNRNKFRKPHRTTRRHFGYRFDKGRPMSPSRSYADFKTAVSKDVIKYKEFTYFDVSSYFNGLYHHDLHAWFAALVRDNPADVAAFGKFLREINAGRSLDCLPQGLFPTKMIGNDFLRFIEGSAAIRASHISRFMDDVYLFDNNASTLASDFMQVQHLLGLKGLSINSSKTRTGGMTQVDEVDDQLSELKTRLLKRRRHLIVSHYENDDISIVDVDVDDDDDDDDHDEDDVGDTVLDEEEIEFVLSLLNADTLSEEDAELIMVVMRDNVSRIEQHLGSFAKGYPHLAKNFYGLCSDASDKDAVACIILEVITSKGHIGEFQLFWFGMMLEGYLLDTKQAPDLVNALYEHRNATDISRAKVLEIADHRYGLPELREAFLREGRSDWLAWASAVGSRKMDKQARNYLLDYFANGSDMNKLIADILQND